MNRRGLMRNAGIAGVLAAGLAPAVHAQAAVRWRLASSFPASHSNLFGAAAAFADAVRAMTGGRFDISVHAGGELMTSQGVVDAVQRGSIEMAHTLTSSFYEKNPAFAIGGGLPFGLDGAQTAAWMQAGNGRKLMNGFYAAYSMVGLDAGNTGLQMSGWYRKPIRKASDFKLLSVRVTGGPMDAVMERLGAVPELVAVPELRQALVKRRIDAAEWLGPSDDVALGLPGSVPYYYGPGWWTGGLNMSFLINQKALAALSTENKAIVEAAAAQAGAAMRARYDVSNATALKDLAARRIAVQTFPPSVIRAVYAASKEVYEENNEKSPEWKKIHADYLAFQRAQLRLSRVGGVRMEALLPKTKA
ncbi:TRAP transporter substrate-binding protein DctP [Variovorax rhizosphaerae]|uniref:TRAP transporter substrate-binding protein DctP n=1 Tax=Variovorax rhizosphaerae TaxID=1836200 RepID=A0ABU8WNU4_9BURK